MNTNQPGPARGERAPDFVLPLQNGTPTRFYALAGGRPTVLIFCVPDQTDALVRFFESLQGHVSDQPPVFAVLHGEPENASQPADHLPVPVFFDSQGKVTAAYRVSPDEPNVLLTLDPNLRVLQSFRLPDAESSPERVVAVLDRALPRDEPLRIGMQAPVLLIPDVLDAETCERLMDVWREKGSVETGVEQSQAGRRQESISYQHKRRRDHIVADKQLLQELTMSVGRRVMPEVYKAFAFRATRFEGFKIVCYDAAAGGFFKAHRDNLSPATAHRRFALTLNLNQDYEGGYLRFPEYGPHLYRPGAGEALVFSCSHLHEVTEVTKGQRFALLSFLFGEGDVRASHKK